MQTGPSEQQVTSLRVPHTQQTQVQSRIKLVPLDSQRITSSEQQVVPTKPMTSIESRAYEQDIEENFKAQIQPILQNYLNKTKRSSPINLFFDMSSLMKF